MYIRSSTPGNRTENNTTYIGMWQQGKGLDTCYSATYMSQTRDQQRFTISEVAADWHEHYSAAVHYVAIHCPR